MTIEIKEVAEKLVLIGVDINCISGKVSRDDIRDGDDKEVFTSGAVRYVHPSVLRPFAAAKQAALRACRNRGTRFWGAWAIAESELPGLSEELSKIAESVTKAKAEVIGRWEEELADWERTHPAAANYRHLFPNRTTAEKGIGVAVSAVRIAPMQGVTIGGAEDAISNEIKSMPMQILHEIATDIRDSWNPGAMKATQSIKGLLGRIANKCRTLAFVGGNLAEVATFVEKAIAALPTTGDITGNDYLILSGVLSLLEKPERVAAGQLSVRIAEDPADAKSTEDTAPVTTTAEVTQPDLAYAW